MLKANFLKRHGDSPDNLFEKYQGLILRVAIPSPMRTYFDYLPPKETSSKTGSLLPGSRVLVPFGKRNILGFVLAHANGSNIGSIKLKGIDLCRPCSHLEKNLNKENLIL